MYEIITEGKQIRKLQKIFEGKFKKAASDITYPNLGFQGGSLSEKTYYLEDEEIWLCPKIGFNNNYEENKYWNAFGLSEPITGKSLNIVCEVNFPLAGINRRIAGAFAENEEGKIVILHRGKIGGGRPGIGKRLFEREFIGAWEEVIDGDQINQLAYVADLYSEDLVKQVVFFTREVRRIKSFSPAEIEASENEGYSPEFQGIKIIPAREKTEAKVNHGRIVDALKYELDKLGYKCGNNRYIDLYTLDKNSEIENIFEIKTDNSTSSIYSAIGQLVVYGTDYDCYSYLVIPEELEKNVTSRLQEIGIEVITYSIVSGNVLFNQKSLKKL